MDDQKTKKLCGTTENKSKTESASETLNSKIQDLTYDVLRIIFKFLNGKDLSAAAMVCRCWRDAAISELKTRGSEYLCKSLEKNNDSCDNYLDNRVVRNLRIKPMLGLIFTGDVENRIFDSVKEGSATDCYCSQLPTSCETVMLRTCETISSDLVLGKNDAVCVFFPTIPKVKVNTFSLDDSSNLEKEKVLDWIHSCSEFGSNEKSKCIMVFSDCDGYKHAIKMLRTIKCKYPKQKLSLIGGIVKDIIYCKRTSEEKFCKKSSTVTVVTLSGPGIHTWSAIIPKKCYGEEEIEEKLKILRENVQLKKFTMGFIFSCVARLENKKMEMRVFKKIFPEIPIAGGFGDGEFGENTIQTLSPRKGKASRSYEFSTVFMILTYG
ncbi:F-box only protein 22-like isoform X1 [Leptopilina heterotoma]|uniref:F-box only protein 22-like isoform X1 n=1 Tax=Leptopilina heterotoma TaxID=63436 RepID=UPI001CA98B35|nr:F-box only protein 22-like isoform X1 [Leptopilina heterotoma]